MWALKVMEWAVTAQESTGAHGRILSTHQLISGKAHRLNVNPELREVIRLWLHYFPQRRNYTHQLLNLVRYQCFIPDHEVTANYHRPGSNPEPSSLVMPETAPAPAPTVDPQPRSWGDINQAWPDEITNAEGIAAAQKSICAALLAVGDIDAVKVTALSDAIKVVRKLAGQAVQNITGKQSMTGTENGFIEAVINQIQFVPKRAKQKYDAIDPGRLADYAVGQKFYSSRAILEQTVTNILLKLKGTTGQQAYVLPSIDAAKITALQQTVDDYQNMQTNQSGAQSTAITARKNLEATITDMVAQRLKSSLPSTPMATCQSSQYRYPCRILTAVRPGGEVIVNLN